jgi:uroporphyrinogen-III synthase
MIRPLEGKTIALAEGRQLEELAGMLEQEGAATIRCPMLSILDAPDPAPVIAWLRELIAGRIALVILMTGEALRRLVGFAEREGLREEVIAALGRTRLLTRGPKPVKALREVGLSPQLVAKTPTTEGVIATLQGEALAGRTVGLTLYGQESNPPLEAFLASAGPAVRKVMPYVYAPAADDDRVRDLLERMAAGTVDVLIFTSSPQVERVWEVAEKRQMQQMLRVGLERTRLAAIGPVVAESLRQRGAQAAICPEQGFQMKNLVVHIKRALA